MKLEKLQIRNFRNYNQLEIMFNKNINVLFGNNGQGKTNIIEAILYLSTTKSHRVQDEMLLIKKNEKYCDLKANIINRKGKKELRIYFDEIGKKIFIFKNNIYKVSDFIGELNAILFSPDDILLFQGTPKTRRKFVDLELGKISKQYTNILSEYNKLLKERNLYLKLQKKDEVYLNVLTEKMINLQKIIIKQRNLFIKDLVKYTNDFYQKVIDDGSKIDCEYQTFVGIDDLEKNLREKYNESLNKDYMYMKTQYGIHKDEFIFKLNNYPVTTFASQGQKRLILLSIKIGLVKMIYEIIKEYPILLLDDIFSELDFEKKKQIMEYLPEETQIFITTTSKNDLEFLNQNKIDYFEVKNNRVNKIGG